MKTSNVKISVIIPIYKVEEYLEQCVSSVINQTLKDIEIILIDDESPDKCPEMCDNFANQDKRIRVVHQKNRGLGGARNAGLEIANGDYIYFLDSDDWITPNGLELLYNKAVQTGTDLVLTGETLFMEETNEYKDGWRDYKDKNSIEGLNEKNLSDTFTPAWGRLYKKDFIDKYKLRFVEKCYFEDNSWGEFMLLFAKKISFCPSIYFYRQRKSSITGEFDLRGLDMIKDFQFFNGFIKNCHCNKRKVKLAYIWQLNRMIGYLFGLPKEYKEEFWKKIKHSIKQMKIPTLYLFYVCRFNKWFNFKHFDTIQKAAHKNLSYGELSRKLGL